MLTATGFAFTGKILVGSKFEPQCARILWGRHAGAAVLRQHLLVAGWDRERCLPGGCHVRRLVVSAESPAAVP